VWLRLARHSVGFPRLRGDVLRPTEKLESFAQVFGLQARLDARDVDERRFRNGVIFLRSSAAGPDAQIAGSYFQVLGLAWSSIWRRRANSSALEVTSVPLVSGRGRMSRTCCDMPLLGELR
jgi:hypothetical protein